jgi:uncharacterized protein
MSVSFSLGTASARPGTIQYGRWDAFPFPTGHTEFLPVIIAQGKEDGPCIWLTAGIHGPEHAGPLVLYRLITEELVDRLRGTIVALPALCPPGLRTMAYVPYHLSENPNRLWPDGRPQQVETDPDKSPPSPQEKAYARLFEEVRSTADYLIDYHNAMTGSISFVFRDRVLYQDNAQSGQAVGQNGQDGDQNRKDASALCDRLGEMINAYGHTVVNEFPVEKYIDEKLHRSTSGAALLAARIPAFTVELGTGPVPDLAIIEAALAGTRNVLRWAGMLDGDPEPVSGIKRVEPDFPVRRRMTPRVPESGIVIPLVDAGDQVRTGDVVAKLCDVWGRPIGSGAVCSEYDGFVIGRVHGIYQEAEKPILMMAIRDDAPLIGPYPTDYFDQD